MKVRHHDIIYLLVILILGILLGRQCNRPTPDPKEIVIIDTTYAEVKGDPVLVDAGVPDSVWRLRLDSILRLPRPNDTIIDSVYFRTVDTVFAFIDDYLTPKRYQTRYTDSNYSLTVYDSLYRNSLVSQHIEIETYNKTITYPKEYKSQLMIGASPTIDGIYGSVLYVDKRGFAAGMGYDPLSNGAIVHAYFSLVGW